MLLEPQDVQLFFKLHRSLMFFVNQRLKVVPDDIASPDAFAALSPQVRLKVRDALIAHVELIESFVGENPAHLSDDELDIVRSCGILFTASSTSSVNWQSTRCFSQPTSNLWPTVSWPYRNRLRN